MCITLQQYLGLVASYNIRPGKGVGLLATPTRDYLLTCPGSTRGTALSEVSGLAYEDTYHHHHHHHHLFVSGT